jgi:hypothetical protein
MKRYEHNATTGETFFVDLSAVEIADLEVKEIAQNAELVAEAQKAADKAALLSKLGITEDEARLLLGGN